ncbi:transcript variant X2 [Nothobranchius furzeri]|uniref:Transcript variant X2 n=1 Tax=Nothobranchius furzeri TaxID=105023 RepID=A0A9D2YXW2_NOTFU|nr:transcript variant X2 [Nothobranchius furzeri]
MGKKRKKHKPEWITVGDFEDKALEKPLKIKLKVGGSEVTELSGSGHDFDDRSDHERERHKEKKKKKKKKSEKDKDKYVDEEERRRRKEEKRKRREREQKESETAAAACGGPPIEPFTLPKSISVSLEPDEKKKKKDRFEGELEVEKFHPAVKSEVEQQGDRPVRSCRTQQENESTPRQQLLEHFLRQLQRKDPHGFFACPVTDAIAPGYSSIIKHPMDFSTIKDKIKNNEYNTITEFKADFKLMCDNAMVYNRPETVYYKAAKKLLHTGFKMMSKVLQRCLLTFF